MRFHHTFTLTILTIICCRWWSSATRSSTHRECLQTRSLVKTSEISNTKARLGSTNPPILTQIYYQRNCCLAANGPEGPFQCPTCWSKRSEWNRTWIISFRHDTNQHICYLRWRKDRWDPSFRDISCHSKQVSIYFTPFPWIKVVQHKS